MSQPAIFPYIIGLEDYYGMTLEEVISKVGEDYKDELNNIISIHGYPLSYNGIKDSYGFTINKVGNHAKTFDGYLEYNWSNSDLTDIQKDALSYIYDYSLNDDNDDYLRMAASYTVTLANTSKTKLLG